MGITGSVRLALPAARLALMAPLAQFASPTIDWRPLLVQPALPIVKHVLIALALLALMGLRWLLAPVNPVPTLAWVDLQAVLLATRHLA